MLMVLPSIRQEVSDSPVNGVGHSQLREFVDKVCRDDDVEAELKSKNRILA